MNAVEQRDRARSVAWLVLATAVFCLSIAIALILVADSIRLAAAALALAAVLNGAAFYLRRPDDLEGSESGRTESVAAPVRSEAESGLPVHPETGFYRWWVFRERTVEEIARAARSERTLAVVLLEPADLLAEPTIQKRAAAGRTLRAAMRATDFVAQYDDDRFVILLPETDHHGTQVASKRLVQALNAFDDPPLRWRAALVSYPKDGSHPDELLEQAQRLLQPGRLESAVAEQARTEQKSA